MRQVYHDHEIVVAVQYLKQGKAVVFATDTAYALGVDATNARAVKRLYAIKQRRPAKPVHIVVSDWKMAAKYTVCGELERKLFKKFLPGPLTIICELRPEVKNLAAWKLLSAGTGTIGIRMPKNKIALALVKKLGRPITATSANISSAPTAYSVSQINWQYRRAKLKPDLILDSGKLHKVQPSTMVRLQGSRIKIVRRGPISKKQISAVIASEAKQSHIR